MMIVLQAIILFSALMIIEGSQHLTKALDRTLLINTECSDASQSQWFINHGEHAPPQWVQSDGNLLLPTDDWRAYGIVINQCGAVNNSYEVFGLGEQCTGCLLQYFTPNSSNICVGDEFTVTISTNLSRPHGNAFTLDVNSKVCYSGGGGDNIVLCREEAGNVEDRSSYSYHVTALNAGTVAIQAHTSFYHLGFHSTTVVVMIRECHIEANNATDATVTPNDATDTSPPTEQPSSSGSGSGDGHPHDDGVSSTPPPTGDTPPSSVPVQDEENDYKEIIIAVACVFTGILLIVIIVIIAYKCRQQCVNNKTDTNTLTMQQQQPPANYGLPVDAMPREEESRTVADGRQVIDPLPGNSIIGLVEES